MEREMLGYLFKYENDMLFKKRKGGKKWTCCNLNKPNRQGYGYIYINDKGFMLHRLVYLFHNPQWNYENYIDNTIDHINQNKNDNRIENLRIATTSENLRNVSYRKGKPIKGIWRETGGWRASWQENKIRKTKRFKTENEALEYRKKMVDIHYLISKK